MGKPQTKLAPSIPCSVRLGSNTLEERLVLPGGVRTPPGPGLGSGVGAQQAIKLGLRTRSTDPIEPLASWIWPLGTGNSVGEAREAATRA